jgi:hypothetical protein
VIDADQQSLHMAYLLRAKAIGSNTNGDHRLGIAFSFNGESDPADNRTSISATPSAVWSYPD